MLYAERLPALPSARTIVVPVVALVIGAAAATGTYAVLDEDTSGSQATAPKVIVADPPAQPGAGVGAKNEAGVAAAIGNPAVSPQTGLKDEASTRPRSDSRTAGSSSAAARRPIPRRFRRKRPNHRGAAPGSPPGHLGGGPVIRCTPDGVRTNTCQEWYTK